MVPVGYVATKRHPNGKGRGSPIISLHVMRSLPSVKTMCGLHTIDDILPDETDCYGARTCGRCVRAVVAASRR